MGTEIQLPIVGDIVHVVVQRNPDYVNAAIVTGVSVTGRLDVMLFPPSNAPWPLFHVWHESEFSDEIANVWRWPERAS